MKRFAFAWIGLSLIILTGCTKSIQIKMLEPAEIDRAASTKRIAVSEFKDDSIGLAGKIESRIAQQRVDGTLFFTTISRDQIDRIVQEQQLQNSGVVKDDQVVEVGEILGAQAFITGEVSSTSLRDNRFFEERFECADRKCKEMRKYLVPCQRREISLGASIKMTDVSRGDIIYAQSYAETRRWKSCRDDARTLPSKATGLEQLANEVASQFVAKLTPHYRTRSVELLDDPDIKYSDRQEKTLELGLEYLEAGRLDKAEKLLGTLLDSTDSRSYVAAYNLGVVKEAQGDYAEASRLYRLADDLQLEPVEAINRAVVRIRQVMQKHEQAQLQLAK